MVDSFVESSFPVRTKNPLFGQKADLFHPMVCRTAKGTVLCKFFELRDEIVAVVRMDLDDQRLGKVEAENAEDRLRVHDVFVALQVDLIGIVLHDLDELFYVLRHLKRNFDGFHIQTSMMGFLYYT